MLTCRIFGHRWRFSADGATMRWRCERGCGAEGTKLYDSSKQAARYAAEFDLEDRNEIGRRSPYGMLPLRLLRRTRR